MDRRRPKGRSGDGEGYLKRPSGTRQTNRMSLQPIAVDFCQSSALRGRRRSSIRPQNLLPALGYASNSNRDESAVVDDVECTITQPTTAHTSSQSIHIDTSRHHDALTLSSPKTTSTITTNTTDSYFEAKSYPKDLRLQWRLASALFQYFLNGWGDGVTGTALPYFEAEFHLTYMTSSLLFAGTMTGFTLGTLVVPRVVAFLGRHDLSKSKATVQLLTPFRSLVDRSRQPQLAFLASQARFFVVILTSIGSPTNFLMMGSQRGLALMFIAYVIISFARAISTAELNLFLANHPSKALGYAFGLWGLGAVISPLIFQALAARIPWAHFYFGSLVLVALNMTFLFITFMPTTPELVADRNTALAQMVSPSEPTRTPIKNSLRLAVRMPYLWAVAAFTVLYCGTETTTQGLVVQYLLAERDANPNTVGYVSSGFWLGVTINRVAWSYFSSQYVLPRHSCPTSHAVIAFPSAAVDMWFSYACVGLVMQVLMWLVKSTVANAVSVSIIGLCFAPVFPSSLELANDLLPVEVHMIAMGIVYISCRQPVLPFVTGVITTEYTMKVWPYMTITATSCLFITWFLFPTHPPIRRVIKE
ncbi:MFS domain-containing protein [Mycena chlorophos]|uniref:MFS domain-containing protein n=1 Tax=Mycena chlorophos TaxID=658473 RepID=A0A8H6W9H9_MYCCL|nr:MFS domain-containing protein [Mycena chlorophos]